MQILQPLKAVSRFRPKARIIGSFILGCLFVLPLCKAQIDVYGVLTSEHSAPGYVGIFDTQTNAQLGSPITVGNNPIGSAITPDGLYAYTANEGSNTVSVIDLATRTLVGTINGIGSTPFTIAVSPDDRFAYVTNANSNTVSVIDVATNKVVGAPIPVGVEPIGVAVSPDGQFVYVSDNGSNSVSVINSATRSVVASLSTGTSPYNLALSPGGQFLYVVNEGSNNVTILNTATHQLVNTVPVGPAPTGIAFTPDGKFAYITNHLSDSVSSQITTINFPSFAQTPNQLAGAQLLNAIELDPRASELTGYFLTRPLPDIPAELDLFSPEALSAFYEISFSNANIQRLMLENRLDAIRAHNSSPSLIASPGGNVVLEKGAGDGKTAKNPVQPVLQPSPEYPFGVWASGFGDFVNLDSDFNARGYRFTTGGFDVGVDYGFVDHFAIGVVGSYSHTWTDLRPGTITVNSGRGGLYATYFNGGYYFNAGIYGGYNTYDTSRASLGWKRHRKHRWR